MSWLFEPGIVLLMTAHEDKALNATVRTIRLTSIRPAIVITVADFLIHAGGVSLFRIKFIPLKLSFAACGKTMLSAWPVFKL